MVLSQKKFKATQARRLRPRLKTFTKRIYRNENTHVHPPLGGATKQPKRYRSENTNRFFYSCVWAQRIGQKFSRLRNSLRRRPAPLHRKSLELHETIFK